MKRSNWGDDSLKAIANLKNCAFKMDKPNGTSIRALGWRMYWRACQVITSRALKTCCLGTGKLSSLSAMSHDG
jgi:hypothetical protein